jgi:hypothetical protein
MKRSQLHLRERGRASQSSSRPVIVFLDILSPYPDTISIPSIPCSLFPKSILFFAQLRGEKDRKKKKRRRRKERKSSGWTASTPCDSIHVPSANVLIFSVISPGIKYTQGNLSPARGSRVQPQALPSGIRDP